MAKFLDGVLAGHLGRNINLSVPWYLMAAYAYYKEDAPILMDHTFDELAKTMLDNWDKIEHFHKHYITVSDLEAGSFLGEYPSRVPYALHHVREKYQNDHRR